MQSFCGKHPIFTLCRRSSSTDGVGWRGGRLLAIAGVIEADVHRRRDGADFLASSGLSVTEPEVVGRSINLRYPTATSPGDLPFAERPRKHHLSSIYDMTGVPSRAGLAP
jgi:hypothetical protein